MSQKLDKRLATLYGLHTDSPAGLTCYNNIFVWIILIYDTLIKYITILYLLILDFSIQITFHISNAFKYAI